MVTSISLRNDDILFLRSVLQTTIFKSVLLQQNSSKFMGKSCETSKNMKKSTLHHLRPKHITFSCYLLPSRSKCFLFFTLPT